jgi:hypothetical protein
MMDTMPVGISLDNGQNLTPLAYGALDLLKIMPESGKVDFNSGRTRDRHGELR